MADTTSSTLAPVAVASLVGLLLTSVVVAILCRAPLHPSLTWVSLFLSALSFILIAAAATFFIVWCLCRILKEEIGGPAGPLIAGVWTSSAWLPLLALLVQENSTLVAAILPLIAVAAALSLRRRKPDANASPSALKTGSSVSLFEVRREPSLLQSLLPAAVASVAIQAALAALLMGRVLLAGMLFAVGMVLPVWRFPAKVQAAATELRAGGRSSKRDEGEDFIHSFVTTSLFALVLTAVALMPFLGGSRVADGVSALLLPASVRAAPRLHTKNADPWNYYSGLILMLPAKPRKEIVPPAPTRHVALRFSSARPLIIPFDGSYWYFKRPAQRPRPDAQVVRGDSMKVNIHSTDTLPLSMEAHQHLGSPIEMSCCSSLWLAVRNADNRIGTISMEILLRDTAAKGTPTQSLGSVVVRSSQDRQISLHRAPVDEVLKFSFPRGTIMRKFDEITVVIHPSRERDRAGAKIAVRHFELVP